VVKVHRKKGIIITKDGAGPAQIGELTLSPVLNKKRAELQETIFTGTKKHQGEGKKRDWGMRTGGLCYLWKREELHDVGRKAGRPRKKRSASFLSGVIKSRFKIEGRSTTLKANQQRRGHWPGKARKCRSPKGNLFVRQAVIRVSGSRRGGKWLRRHWEEGEVLHSRRENHRHNKDREGRKKRSVSEKGKGSEVDPEVEKKG